MTVKQLKEALADFPDDKELHVSEHGKTMAKLLGVLEGKTNNLLILTGEMEFGVKTARA